MFTLWKEIGETPLEALERARSARSLADTTKLTYAGRLDPLADGVLLILEGEECKSKEQHLAHDKVYETDIVFGISSDTHDPLGRLIYHESPAPTEESIHDYLRTHVDTFTQAYPAYSSKSFNHKRESSSSSEYTHVVTVYEASLLSYTIESLGELAHDAINNISRVTGDFRQIEAISDWKHLAETHGTKNLCKIRIKLHVGSGFYVRQFAHDMGTHFSPGAIAFRITRTQVGEYACNRV